MCGWLYDVVLAGVAPLAFTSLATVAKLPTTKTRSPTTSMSWISAGVPSPSRNLGRPTSGASETRRVWPGSGSAYVAVTGLVTDAVVVPSFTVRVTFLVPVLA